MTDTVSIGSRIVMNYLANKNGMFMKKIENQTMTSITVSNDDQPVLTIRGTQYILLTLHHQVLERM